MISIKNYFFLALLLLEPKVIAVKTVLRCNIKIQRVNQNNARKRFCFKNYIHSCNFTLSEKDLLFSY